MWFLSLLLWFYSFVFLFSLKISRKQFHFYNCFHNLGSSTAVSSATNSNGDGGTQYEAQFNKPYGIHITSDDLDNVMYIADKDDNKIRMLYKYIESPTAIPVFTPTVIPTLKPSVKPTGVPTIMPTKLPTVSPSATPFL